MTAGWGLFFRLQNQIDELIESVRPAALHMELQKIKRRVAQLEAESVPKGGKRSPPGCPCLPASSIATSHLVPIPALAQTSMGSAADAPTEHDIFDS